MHLLLCLNYTKSKQSGRATRQCHGSGWYASKGGADWLQSRSDDYRMTIEDHQSLERRFSNLTSCTSTNARLVVGTS